MLTSAQTVPNIDKDIVDPHLALRLTNVSKHFKLYNNPARDPFFDVISFWKKSKRYSTFQALTNVSFEVRRGEILGIIGANGAGKTTLLKIIAGLLKADDGNVEVYGRVTALLALGLASHPEFSGRENIIYNGLLVGLSRNEIQNRLPDIVEFAELEAHIDRPLRTYSSGMKARLFFSTAVSVTPDILIVDEALSTGDVRFMRKCVTRIRELTQSGATVLFVSHNTQQVKDLCRRCIWLENGEMRFDGDPGKADYQYVSKTLLPEKTNSETHPPVPSIEEPSVDSSVSETLPAPFISAEMRDAPSVDVGDLTQLGTGQVNIQRVTFFIQGQPTNVLEPGKPWEAHFECDVREPIQNGRLFLKIWSAKTHVCYAFVPPIPELILDGSEQNVSLCQGYNRIILKFPALAMTPGSYATDVLMFPGDPDYIFSYDTLYCHYQQRLVFEVSSKYQDVPLLESLTEIPISMLNITSGEAA